MCPAGSGNLGDHSHIRNLYEYRGVSGWLTSRMSAWPDVDGNHRASVGNLTTCIIRRCSNATPLEPIDMQASKHNETLIVYSASVINLCLGNLGDQAHETNLYEDRGV